MRRPKQKQGEETPKTKGVHQREKKTHLGSAEKITHNNIRKETAQTWLKRKRSQCLQALNRHKRASPVEEVRCTGSQKPVQRIGITGEIESRVGTTKQNKE